LTVSFVVSVVGVSPSFPVLFVRSAYSAAETPGEDTARATAMTATSYLIRPTPVFRESYLDALREGFGGGAGPAMDESRIAAAIADFDAHLASLDKDGQAPHVEFGRTLPSVPANTFWLVDGGEFIGAVNIRARADSHVLAHFGGHVGYGIRPSLRGRGYGTRQLALALQICRGMGIGIVRISCAEDNVASRRIIEKNGGVLLRHCEAAWYSPQPYLLFEIILV
jgi:predicted acetyltransferase